MQVCLPFYLPPLPVVLYHRSTEVHLKHGHLISLQQGRVAWGVMIMPVRGGAAWCAEACATSLCGWMRGPRISTPRQGLSVGKEGKVHGSNCRGPCSVPHLSYTYGVLADPTHAQGGLTQESGPMLLMCPCWCLMGVFVPARPCILLVRPPGYRADGLVATCIISFPVAVTKYLIPTN